MKKGLLVVFAVLFVAGVAFSQTLTWVPNTSYTDSTGATGTFSSAEMATMKYYLRARKQGDTAARKYFGEPALGVATWTGDLSAAFAAKGLAAPSPGEFWEITVSEAFKGADGIERDSAESVAAVYQFPFGPSRVPGAPGAPVITE